LGQSRVYKCFIVTKDPLPVDPLPGKNLGIIKNGKVFKLGGAIGKFHDKREIPSTKIVIMEFDFKDSE
jgi:hypothetical protein